MSQTKLHIQEINISELKELSYNPRKWSEKATKDLKESISKFGLTIPLLVNSAKNRENIIIGGNFRFQIAKDLGFKKIPVIFINLPDIEKEKELCIRLNKNIGEFNIDLLSKFDENFLSDVGFSSQELDSIFETDDVLEEFNLNKELKKLGIKEIKTKKGDLYALGKNRLLCGDSTIEVDMLKLMNGKKADFCLTDPPYLLDYLNAKRHGKSVTGFGAKKNRRYLETDVLPDDFTEKWMENISKIQNDNFSIIVYENWKNIRTIWGEMEKYWKIKNMLVWHLPNRHQGFSAKYKFFSKHDIAIAGATPDKNIEFNLTKEKDGLQEEYETALFAISGKPHWEGYSKGQKDQPTDFIQYVASDEQHSGQGVIFGTKPVEILIPYIKVLTKRDDLIVEPFGGSGSTLIASTKMKRRCYIMEKSPVYTEVIIKRWEKLTGEKAKKING